MTLLVISFLVAAMGTMIGVGGGFLLVPILLYLYPDQPSSWISTISIWFIAFNATSGSIAYLRKRTVHLRAAAAFILACLPGSIVGVWLSDHSKRAQFEMIFGLVMAAYSIFLFFKRPGTQRSGEALGPQSKLPTEVYLKGCAISLGIGVISSFLGIGGGVIHVPLMVHVLGFPVHLATGTSHAILAMTAWFAVITHILSGDIIWSDPILWQTAIGALSGAQLGAYLSPKVKGPVIMRFLAVAMMLIAARLLWRVF